MFTEKVYRGFLFIGDPHVSSKRIGRRKDDYLSSVLAKLEACAEICARENLLAVCLGDLFHKNDDNGLQMLNRLTRCLKKFPEPMLVLDGNHDLGRAERSDDDALTLLGQTGVVQVLNAGLVAEFRLEAAGSAVRLWAAPYGSELPARLPSFEGTTILISHHDLAFGGSYPGALPLKEMHGCDIVVNGHMHDTKSSVAMGETVWHNPGNIEPLSVDLAHHVPCAWEWVPAIGKGSLRPHTLPHGTDLFDMAGLQVAAAGEAETAQTLPPQESSFAKLLARQNTAEAARTEDAAVLHEDLGLVFLAQNSSEAVRRLLLGLAAELPAKT